MSRRSAARVALLALALLAAHACTATAAQTTIQPSPAEARTFATTNGGWSSAVDYNGLVCIPGITCPSANPTYQATGGAGGAGDGHLRDSFATLLGVLSTTTIDWTSPSFVATTADTATLSVDVRPQIASLLAIGSLRLDMTLVDVADGTRTTTIASVPLTAASASFSTVQATVPPGTIVNGRTYRVELGVSLTTSVSAVTSGTVDLDNVVLRLVDLEPPTGLTASFPGTGSPRVEGTVDPAGQLTSVTVDYGLTAAYGTTTSAVTVNGSGSQPFTVPLAGLTPGQTYHYRVTAQNADGSIQTNDATFVAPAAPSDAPPVVTGAGNSRNRTVTYDRPGDVVAATVELLDATGATVLDSVDDADGDGSVAIVLPDADGTYQVRVVRENAARVTSTSATVPAVLDRVAPATGAVDLRVTPAVSSDTQRTVSFVVPGDVVTATAQVIDSGGSDVGAPVAALGGSAIVQLGSADGDYRVRLTLTDAAGNAATVLSDPVTLDATAPSAGGAPTVTGAGNSRDRDVSFDRDPTTVTATIEALDGSGTVVATATVLLGDSGTIRLPDADGDYTIRVRQADLAGNSATSAGTPVTLDRVAPGAGPAPTVSGPATGRDREISFQRDPEATSAVIELLDGGGAVIDTVAVPSGSSGQIRLPDLDGSYSVRVRQSDAATNSATSPATAIVLDRVAPDPGPAPTVTGSEISRDREVTFERAPDAATAVIEVLDQTSSAVVTVPVPAGGRAIVTLPDLDGDYTVRVTQSDAAGNSATTPGTGVTLDRGAPAPGPAPTVTGADNGRERTVRFTRDPETTAAAILVFDSGGTLVATVPVPSGAGATIALPDLDGDYTVRVRQENRFGIASLTLPTAVALDRQPPDAGPAPTLGNDDPDALQVTFRRAPDAATAVIEVVDAAGDVVLSVPVPSGETATIDLPDAPGAYGIRVVQRDAAGNGATTPTTAYTRRAPLNPSDDDPTPTTPTTPTTPGGPGGPTAPTTPDGARSITDPGKLGGVLRQCFGGDVVLTDVTMRGTRVTVRGLTRFATGTPIAIVDLAGKRVGSASSGADGRFSARVVAPRAARARLAGGYRAVVGTTRSPVVRVRRANVVTGVRVRGTTITITGRVDLARLGRVKRIRGYGGAGAAACRRSPQLKAIGPTLVNRRTGAYTLRVRAPSGSGRLVLRTRVFGTRIASRSSFVVR